MTTNTLYDALIAPHSDRDTPFLHCDDGSTISYAGFVRRAAQMAQTLADAGVGPGDRVVVQAPKLADTIALYAGCLQAGAVYLPLNTAYTKDELAYFVGDAAPKLLVCEANDEDNLAEIAAGVAAQVHTLNSDSTGTLATAADAQSGRFDTVARGPDDLAALLYTSGTTGRSKGAMLSHKNLLSNARVLADLWQITDQDRLVHALPIFHTHGLFVAMNTSLLAGSQIRFMEGFNLDGIIAALPKATMMMGVPTFYTRLLGDTRFDRDLVQTMRLIVSGSAPLLAETHRSFEHRTGHRILERYGMTETNMITSNPFDGARVAGTVGFALPGCEVQITNEGSPVAAGEVGMIEVRGNNVFQGYWNMPEKTREELRESGYFITGDLGVMDAEGRVSIVGREKDLIISGGYNIYPKEIEDVLNDVKGVVETAVFGVPNADFGESVVAAVVGEAPEAALNESAKEKLARFKHPRRYVFLDSLPRNTMGKVQKNVLRATFGPDSQTGV